MVKVKKWIIFISIILIILGFCKYITMQQEIEYKDKIMLCVTFTGLFATFGGAYLGARISGDSALKIEINRRNEEFDKEAMILKNQISIYVESIYSDLYTNSIYFANIITTSNKQKIHYTNNQKEITIRAYLYYCEKNRHSILNKLNKFLTHEYTYILIKSDINFYNNLREYVHLIKSSIRAAQLPNKKYILNEHYSDNNFKIKTDEMLLKKFLMLNHKIIQHYK